MKGIVNVSKVMISCALLLGVGVAYSESTESSHNSTSAATLSKHFTIKKSNGNSRSLPKKLKYTKRVKKGVGYVTYSGYLTRVSYKKSGGKYIGTYSGTLKGRWS
ncbi:TPA: hypothetical protein ACHHQJ_002745 [Staphylococcus aureus]